MSKQLIKGLHHVTTLARGAQENVDFYSGLLGLRLVKKTINFDAPQVYHLYYGDETGNPGSIMTSFPYGNMLPGSKGAGQATKTTFSIPKGALDYWLKRLEQFGVKHEEPESRFDEVAVYFEDMDGLGLELVANDKDDRTPFSYGHIPLEHSIRGFYSIELWEQAYEQTESVLVEQLDHQFISEKGSRRRYSVNGQEKAGQIIDIVWNAQQAYGRGGSGTVHHIAFETPSDEDQLAVREKILSAGLRVTEVLDRQYFHSIYFREPGGVLFEVATTPPGFLFDEEKAHLGEDLKLPPWEEYRRNVLEKQLPPITLNPEKYASTS